MVYDRDENACERAKEAGAKICEYKDLSKVLKKAAFLFNTAPSAVWTEGLLEGVPQEVCILELLPCREELTGMRQTDWESI